MKVLCSTKIVKWKEITSNGIEKQKRQEILEGMLYLVEVIDESAITVIQYVTTKHIYKLW